MSEVWDNKTIERERAIAQRLFRHEVFEDHDEYRESCASCVLKGYLSDSAQVDGMTETDGPNYAGWARVYVQAGRTIPLKWFDAFQAERKSDNRLYADCLDRDIVTFGVRFQ